MNKFARLLVRESGEQVLMQKERDQEDNSPGFSIRFNTAKGNHARLLFSFDSEVDRDMQFENVSDQEILDIVDSHNETSPL